MLLCAILRFIVYVLFGGGATNKIREKQMFKLVRYAALICLRRVKKITFLRF